MNQFENYILRYYEERIIYMIPIMMLGGKTLSRLCTIHCASCSKPMARVVLKLIY